MEIKERNISYEEAVSYIESTPKFTSKNSLEHTRRCLALLGNPEKCFRIIHVAGTNGKGSTCAFLDSVLRCAGHSCGLFTSPHLVRINERFVVNGVMIRDEEFLRSFRQVMEMVDRAGKEGLAHPTYFELLFLMSMVIFRDAGVSFAILETGLGGRLDATTAAENPILCVITSVSIDHVQYLGNTIREIAGEKAGILVKGVPCVLDGNDGEALLVLREKARETGAPFRIVKRSETRILRYLPEGIVFRYGRACRDKTYTIPFIADYQVMNAALCIASAEELNSRYPGMIPEKALSDGLRSACWPGRMEQILPGVIVDGAHNEDGIRRFLETAQRYSGKAPLTLLYSSVSDKNYKNMISEITKTGLFRSIVTTQVGGPRQAPAQTLAELFRQGGAADTVAEPDPEAALRRAFRKKGEDGILFCVGSLYLVGMIKALNGGKSDDRL